MNVTVAGKEADLRLSTFRTSHGEKAVLRVIPREVDCRPWRRPDYCRSPSRSSRNSPKAPGHDRRDRSDRKRQVDDALHDPSGLNEPGRNIVTLEDPIEKKIPGSRRE